MELFNELSTKIVAYDEVFQRMNGLKVRYQKTCKSLEDRAKAIQVGSIFYGQPKF